MLPLLNPHEKQILTGNILFIVCCLFYIAWWLLAFKPTGAITGFKTGWLLIPAFVTGLLGVIWAIQGIVAKPPGNQLLPGLVILVGGGVFFLILLIVTVWLFKRQPTTELILIVGWGIFALAEVNALFGFGLFSQGRAIGFIAVIGLAVLISLVCYVLFFRLDNLAGYIDGMIPLLLAALIMAGISGFMLIPSK